MTIMHLILKKSVDGHILPENKEKIMKKVITLIALIALHTTFTFAQTDNNQMVSKTNIADGSKSNLLISDIKMRTEYGSEDNDLMSTLRFEDIGLSKMIFSGNDLKGKDFQISVKEYVNGKLTRKEVIFDSKESEYFKIKNDNFMFRILTKITSENVAKFQFQFNGFSTQKEYKIAATDKGFAQKDFLGSTKETAIPLNTSTYILTYMMPYDKKDGSKQYCEVAQSGANPEEFGVKYALPRYFLIDIKFQ
jgi:hypothetical protein